MTPTQLMLQLFECNMEIDRLREELGNDELCEKTKATISDLILFLMKNFKIEI